MWAWLAVQLPSISFRAAAAPHASLAFLLVGAAITVPMTLGYNVCAYSVFKGKMRAAKGYH
jgi:cytochrome d ubiquinol oxidase subunit II